MAKSLLLIVALLIVANTLTVQQQHTDFAKIETGQLMAMQQDGDTWHNVALQNQFSSPVVLMQITSYNGGHPVHIRLRNVMSSSFQFKMEEWEYLDEWHTDEQINFIVAESGTYNLACGRQLTVGTIDGVMEDWVNVDFVHEFKTLPVVFSLCQTHNGGDAVVTRTKEIGTQDFQVKLKEQEAQDGVHPNAETVGFFAIEGGHCDGLVANKTEEEYQHEWKAIPFGKTFKEAPLTFVTILSHNGGNPAGIRMTNLKEDSVEVFIEEEQSDDTEMNHVKETLGWLVLEAPNTLAVQIKGPECTPEVPPECNNHSCADLELIVQDVYAAYDVQGDGQINAGDELSEDELQLLVNYCDLNGDSSVSICEMYDCLVWAENEWIATDCVEGAAELDCPEYQDERCECYGAWSCDDINMITDDIFDQLDTNEDSYIDLGDNIDGDHVALLLDECDENNDSTLDRCEVYNCVVQVENEWRVENCPAYGFAYCELPYECDCECPDAWNCDELYQITLETIAYYDNDGNNAINPEDNIDEEHFWLMAELCDSNNDGHLEECEIHYCLQQIENEWRLENCPMCPDLTCPIEDCIDTDVTCPGAWNCVDIIYITDEVMEAYDTNWDGYINLGDSITDDHFNLILEECDYDGDESICSWEVYQCLVNVENEWRDEYCPLENHIYCQNPYQTCPDCDGMWTCTMIEEIRDNFFNFYNGDDDLYLTDMDNITEEQLLELSDLCDSNADNIVDICEIHDCIVAYENEWRDEYCPDYGNAYCPCGIDVPVCPGAWECDDLEQVSYDVLAYYDTDVSGTINPADAIDDEHYGVMISMCDTNFDGNLEACEIFVCIEMAENEWRAENCPEYPMSTCDCPFGDATDCAGEWNCLDMIYITDEFMNSYDTNGDGSVDLGDYMDNDHLELLLTECDANMDGTLTACEIHDCEVRIENEWRAVNCGEDYPQLYCTAPYDCTPCPGIWTCGDIEYITEDFFATYNTNGDSVINMGDNIDQDHLNVVLSDCDYDQDGNIEKYEIFDCLVMVENDYRAEYCEYNYPQVYCINPYEDECPLAWSCQDMENITNDYMYYVDTNGDGSVSLEDYVDEDHYNAMVTLCDFNDDGAIQYCEVFECLTIWENEWRDAECPTYGDVVCNNPYDDCDPCPESFNCSEIEQITVDVFNWYNTNGDDQLNLGDGNYQSNDELAMLLEYCDYNQNGQVTYCELHDCLVECENEWRASVCPEYPLTCEADKECVECEGAWSCEDVADVTDATISGLDSNGDGVVSYGDNLYVEDMAMLLESCDSNGNDQLEYCELYNCIVMCENEWRADNCDWEYGQLYCICEVTQCEGEWNCDDVKSISDETLMYYDNEVDMNINLDDDIDPEHYEMLVAACDQDNDGNIDACEIFDCVIATENQWRMDYCGPNYPMLYCPCPYDDIVCVGAWSCYDIEMVTNDFMATYDTDGDSGITYGDSLNDDHLEIIMSACDADSNGIVGKCEAFDCIVMAENMWRDEYCPESEHVFCELPYDDSECLSCPNEWTCEDIDNMTNDFWATFDNNGDGQVNLGDNIEGEHLDALNIMCDFNQDGSICKGEYFDCLVAYENEWRAEYCPGYPMAYCTNDYWENCTCEGAWSCDDIMVITMEQISYFDSNGDDVINPEDTLDYDQYLLLVDLCDSNNDGTLDLCELHVCVVNVENEWRAANCPSYGYATCPCHTEPVCPSAWDCTQIFENTNDTWAYLDTDGNDMINLGDEMTDDHYDFLMTECDLDGNGQVCRYELFECMIMVENDWRHENCPEAEDIYCQNPFECPYCPGEWTCMDIENISEAIMNELDTDNNGYVNLGDNIDADHMACLNDYCDINGDQMIDCYEMNECVLMAENEWRQEYCEAGYWQLQCNNPCEPEICQGAMICDDIQAATIEIIYYYDTNGDFNIDLNDDVDIDHYSEMIQYCDADNNGSIEPCEIQNCLVDMENEWREAACPGYGLLEGCDCEDVWCEGEWNCTDIYYITEDFMAAYDSNGDLSVNYGDNIENDHLDLLVSQCDQDMDGSVSTCEIYECVVVVENDWRATACPVGYPQLFCTTPYECATCPDAWSCETIHIMTEQIFAELNANGDGAINAQDGLDSEHLDMLQYYCDANGNGDVTRCELFDCMVIAENEYRQEYCPEFGLAYCENPMTDCGCDGMWSCEEIEAIALDNMIYYDTNGDGSINPEDVIDADHYALMVENCDMNDDGTISGCEMQQCIVNIENEWRQENCPEYGAAHCPCSEPTCVGAMTCYEIAENTQYAMATYDTDGNGYIDEADEMLEQEHLYELVSICDQDGSLTLSMCELFDCLVMAENEWRADQCPEFEEIYCSNPFEELCGECQGQWTCEDIELIAMDMHDAYDVNGDGSINLGDNLDNEHYDILMQDCDTDMNGDISMCEIFDCVVRIENEWRAEYCPDYPQIYCENPDSFECTCDGMWSCMDIDAITLDIITYYDSDDDMAITPEDAMDEDHYALMIEECDTNYDGALTVCEVHQCIVNLENAWRNEYCPWYGDAYCPCEEIPCDGAWSCYDVHYITEDMFEVMDTNYDGQLNLGDVVEQEHLDAMAMCDEDMNGSISKYELFNCLVIVENEWRAENCPNYPNMYCENPYINPECAGAWTCEDIHNVTQATLDYYNTNGDEVINYGDDAVHEVDLNNLMDWCDFNGDNVVTPCELHQCTQEYENWWRTEYCPEYGYSYCDCSFYEPECPGHWTCQDIEDITLSVIASYDTNSDSVVNVEDGSGHGDLMYCDTNDDGTVDMCEMHQCIVNIENNWRAEYCPEEFGFAYCDCPFPVYECPGAWNCADLVMYTDDFMAAMDTNGDGFINLGDQVGPDHLDMLISECDQNMDGDICESEVYDCLLNAENEWRAEVCPDIEPLYCSNPYGCPQCDGAWTCDNIKEITEYCYDGLDTNDDGVVDQGDNLETDHWIILQSECDTNNDMQLNRCEIFDCVVMCENAWRVEYCPSDYTMAYCNCPFTIPECPGAWSCEDIKVHVEEIMAYYDLNGDNNLNPDDLMNDNHYELLVELCDVNNDGSIDFCEMHACAVDTENEWRMEYCPEGFGLVYCDCPMVPPECPGAWNCAIVIQITEDFMNYYDTNGDNDVDLGDSLESDHLDIVLELCDADDSGSLHYCEVFDCVVACENQWRDEYCPEIPHLFCQNPYENDEFCPECFAAWNCQDVADKTQCIMDDWDSNGDGQLNLEDAIDSDHMMLLNEMCDQDGSQSLHDYEVFDCLVMIENEWRAENCPNFGDLFCENPYDDVTCDGAWSCDDIAYITDDIFVYYDTDMDTYLSIEDQIESDHFAILLDSCDTDMNGSIEWCEMQQCIVMCENAWREEYCDEEFGYVYCPCDEEVCEGEWNCVDIAQLTSEYWTAWNSNEDEFINAGDLMESDHFDLLVDQCDYNQDGQISQCEIYKCLIDVENAWRLESCDINYPPVNCPPEVYPCPVCNGHWDCEAIMYITNDMGVYDTNNDGSINNLDEIEQEHLDILIESCDYSGNGSLEYCEYHACVIAYENWWRDENCPGYGHVYCDCPAPQPAECPAAWSCDDVEYYLSEAFAYYDTDGNGVINPADDIDEEHLAMYISECDEDFDGNLEVCELHQCILDIENQFRMEYCPDFGLLYCECPTISDPECPGEWNCWDITMISDDFINAYDTNNDGAINMGDYIDEDHLDIVVEYCDFNNDGTLSHCEIFECVELCENEWRLYNCPEGYQQLYCEAPYECAQCTQAWTCDEIVMATEAFMAENDVNGDDEVNLGDLSEEHLYLLSEYCIDENQDGSYCSGEIMNCIIAAENEWRAENCPGYGDAFCAIPEHLQCNECAGSWDCEDIEYVSLDILAYYDNNGDYAINPQDNIDQDHYNVMIEYCDYNNDGTIDACEVHQCVVECENAWRDEYCDADFGYVYCPSCPFDVPECEGAWNCADITYYTEETMAVADTNGDGQINYGDNIDEDMYTIIMGQCDFDGNDTVDACEIFDCIVECENAWRADYCPESEPLYCTCPLYVEECPGAWFCEDIYNISLEVISTYDTNVDGNINVGDSVDADHMDILMDQCDINQDGNIDQCEVHTCIMNVENAWRDEYCPNFGYIYCENPFEPCVQCEGAWNCNDVNDITLEVIAYYDTNGDYAINPQDTMEESHYSELVYYCDFNNDGTLDACEIHDCIVICENEWRAENCDITYGQLYCDCDFIVPVCEGAWNCADITMITDETMYALDTNGDLQVNYGDDLDSDHVDMIIEYCDTNNDGTVDMCELFECIVNCENEWRAEYCPDSEPVYCTNPYQGYCADCPGHWTCEDIFNIATDYLAAFDTNGDGNLNLGDDIEEEHANWLTMSCDFNGDQNVDSCELHQCILECENAWREANCPEYGYAYCDCPFFVPTCDGAWDCNDIELISIEIIAYYETNGDYAINPEDEIELEHYNLLLQECDFNNDGTIDTCEIHECVIQIENEWRDAYCPDYGYVYCQCPFYVVPCEGAWNCADIMYITDEVMAEYDSDGNMTLNANDQIDTDHLDMMLDYCDFNGDNQLSVCEIHDCIVMCENEWRHEYCEYSEDLYCQCPFADTVPTCDGAWDCNDIQNISVDILNMYDTNYDGSIDMEDNIDADHLAEINANCDFNGDGATDACEVHACIVMIENDWRDEYCPDYGHVYCDCPFSVPTCDGAWDCEDIYNISVEVLNYYDTNYDGSINLEDDIESEHLEILIEYCDYNNDGTVDACEVHQCVVDCENAWRDEYCPDYGHVYCDCPFYVATCDGAWNCDDIYYISVDVINYYDTDYDGDIDLQDDIDPEHLAVLQEQCDYNGDGAIDSCEVNQCIVDIENAWRDEYCPDSEHVFCECPF